MASNDNAPLSRREEYAEATRAALLEAAQALFIEEGVQQVGIEAISRRARVSRGAFYHHFSDKRALFDALVVQLQADAATRVSAKARSGASTGPLDQVSAGIEAFLHVCLEPPYRRLVIQEAPAMLGSERCREIAEQSVVGLFVGALQRLREAGHIDVDNPSLAGHMLGAMVCEAALLLGEGRKPRTMERQALDIMERAVAALRPDARVRAKR